EIMQATLIKPMVKVEKLELDPNFEAGSTHAARATLTNPTAKEFTYDVELYLDVTKVASASGSVTIPAGSSLDVDFTVVMPVAEGTFHVYLDVWVGTELLVHHEALPHAEKDVTIVISPLIEVGPITWI
ncbi:unnamed protein product, partial [marine sediment metagenome]